jgi:hypothetical protein
MPFAGNICRSPTAEAMFRSVVENAGLADSFDIDSCGTGTWGAGANGFRVWDFVFWGRFGSFFCHDMVSVPV